MQRDGATVNRNKLLSRSWNIQLRQPELAGHYKVISSRCMLSFDQQIYHLDYAAQFWERPIRIKSIWPKLRPTVAAGCVPRLDLIVEQAGFGPTNHKFGP